MSRTQERVKRMALLNAVPLGPAVTPNHQKGQGQLIPLKGDHFLRRDTYDIPIEENEEFPIRSRNVKSGKPRSTRDLDPEDSPLSEDELEAVYGGNASPIRSSPHRALLSQKLPDQQQRRSSVAGRPKRRRILQPDAQKLAVPSAQVEPGAVTYNSPPATHRPDQDITHLTKVTPPLTNAPKHAVSSRIDPPRPKPSRETAAVMRSRREAAARRLPVNELLLVRSPSEVGFTPGPHSTSPPIEVQDPIESSCTGDTTSRHGTSNRKSSPIKAPLTSLRRRIKKPKSSHKSIAALQRKALARAPFFKAAKQKTLTGDGFEVSEMRVTHPKPVVKRRCGRRNLAMGFFTLTLEPGPLPDVEFIQDIVKEEVKAEAVATVLMEGETAHTGGSSFRQQHSAEPAQQRTVSFSDRVLDEMMFQRLSSVTAPKRVYPISSDESEGEDYEHDDWNQSETGTHEGDNQGNERPRTVSASPRPATPGARYLWDR